MSTLSNIKLMIFHIFLAGRYDITLGLCVTKATLALNWLESYGKIGKLPSNRLTRFMEIGGRVGVGGGRGAGREVAFSNLEIPNTTFSLSDAISIIYHPRCYH